ncbi:MAG: beta-lactamase, partial [Desertimonas sp.]|nr:beta-lactamase [Desertimonas sp.]
AQDLILPTKVRHGIGFGLPSAETPISPNERTCFWGGWGGSLALVDLDARMTFAYVMNKMGEGTVGDLRAASILATLYDTLAS